ncbi:MAG: hypothetical protein HZA48_05700 [Planctomycetes bacterium]|nr:hypothetical protein [Planctomycetota bacterium]
MSRYSFAIILFFSLVLCPFNGFSQQEKSVAQLINGLDSADRAVQQEAFNQLLRGIEKSAPALLEALKAPSFQVKMWAKQLLMVSGKWITSDALMEETVSSVINEFARAGQEGNFSTYSVDEFFNNAIPDESFIRIWQGNEKFYAALLTKLQSPQRTAGALIAGIHIFGLNRYIGAEDFIINTVSKTKDSSYDISLRCICITALERLDTPKSRAKLLELKTFSDRLTIVYLCYAFTRLRMHECADYIANALKNTEQLVSTNAMTCLRMLADEAPDSLIYSYPAESKAKIAEGWQKWAEDIVKSGAIKKPNVPLYASINKLDELSATIFDEKALGEEAAKNLKELIEKDPDMLSAVKILKGINSLDFIVYGLQWQYRSPVNVFAPDFIASARLTEPAIRMFIENTFLIGRDMIAIEGQAPVYIISSAKGYFLFIQFLKDEIIVSSDYARLRRLNSAGSFDAFAEAEDADCKGALKRMDDNAVAGGFIKPFRLAAETVRTINEIDAFFYAEKVFQLNKMPVTFFGITMEENLPVLKLQTYIKNSSLYDVFRTQPGNRECLKKIPAVDAAFFIAKTLTKPADQYWLGIENCLKETASAPGTGEFDPAGNYKSVYDCIKELSSGVKDSFGFIMIDKPAKNPRGYYLPGAAFFCTLKEDAKVKETIKEFSEKLFGVTMTEETYKENKLFNSQEDDWNWFRPGAAIVNDTVFIELLNSYSLRTVINFAAEKPVETKEQKDWAQLFPAEASTFGYVNIISVLTLDRLLKRGFSGGGSTKDKLPAYFYIIEKEDGMEIVIKPDFRLQEAVALALKYVY